MIRIANRRRCSAGRGRVRSAGALWLLFALSVAGSARAQSTGFALDRFDPAERGSDWFVGESLDLRGSVRPALGITMDWAHKPLVLYDANGDESAAIVKDQLFAHVGGSLVLGSRVRFGANLPIALWQAGETGSLNGMTFAPSRKATVGDLRIGADVRLLGTYGDVATLAVGLQAHLPTGSREAYASDGKIRLTPRLMLAGDIAIFAYSARVGFDYRAQDDAIGGVPTGSELQFVATAGLRVLDRRLLLGPELWGTTLVGKGAAFDKATTPFELVFSGHYRVPNWLFGLGVGPGLTRGLGAPSLRVLASIDWQPDVPEKQAEAEPPAAPADRDHDGIVDSADACPDTPGAPNADARKNGCPPDRDGDGIIDSEDACPDTPGVHSSDPSKNGCPPDRDGDGITDAEDACPDAPGVHSSDPSKNGCPSDRDGDGIIDSEDACPDAPGPRSEDPRKNGCPAARVEQGQIKILERIEFKTGSAVLLETSTPILEAVQAILTQHAEITQLSIEGHTDNVGSPKLNQGLSQRRADSVRKWLVNHSIARTRLTTRGYGSTQPIDSNDTDSGREHNRRVEFHIQQIEGKPAPRDGGGTDTIEER